MGPLQAGSPFGRRYHLIRLLGAGGMGAVYQAWDEELGVVVAIKVIRPEAMADPAAARDLERRFKRELVLARNVTHKNVIRIHDLGEIDGIKYITMPYVHGSDLAGLITREGRLPIPRALKIARQVVSGLVAAHEAGVVHRDLKPANILLDEEDRALITDFGIARSVSGAGGGTVAGMVVGTLEYMAPEQARAEPVDHRADIYAFGLMFADMLIGRRQSARAESAVAELLHRMTNPFPSLRTTDPAIPQALDEIVMRCVNPDPAQRYQRTEDLLADLDAAGAGGQTTAATRVTVIQPPVTALPHPVPLAPGSTRRWLLLSGAAVLLLVIAGAVAFRDRLVPTFSRGEPSAPVRQVSLLILPFRNASGDSSVDWIGPSLANVLRTEVGQSAALRTVPGDRIVQMLSDLKIASDENVDPATLNSLASLSSSDVVLWGQYVKFGDEIRIDATLKDVKRERSVALKATAPNTSALLDAVAALAASTRENLSLSSAAVKELTAAAYQPSSKSVQALRYYSEGLDLSRQGRHLDAVRKFQASSEEDPAFAPAYARLAQSYSALGRSAEAQAASEKAVSLSDSLPPREKYLVLATRARVLNERQKAIEYYTTLDRMAPGNDEVVFALATLYEDTGAYDKAREAFAQLLARDPKYVDALLGAGRVEIRSGNATAALDYLNRALTNAIERGNDEARAGVLRALGVNYRVLNKPQDALRYYHESLDLERRLGRTAGVADSLHAIAQMEDEAGDSEAALRDYRETIDLRRSIGDRQGLGGVLNDLGGFYGARGRYTESLAQFKEALQVQRDVHDAAAEAIALSNIGTTYMALARYDDAQTYLQQAMAIRERINAPSDSADTLHNLAEVSVKTGAYDAALGQYLKALELRRKLDDRRGVAIEQYNLGTLFEYQGRYGAAVDSKSEALKIFEQLGEEGVWLPKVQASYASALNQAGQADQARSLLERALPLARKLQNDALIAQIYNAQGDVFLYAGDPGNAQRLYEQASALAKRARLPQQQMTARLNLAMASVASGAGTVSPAVLRQLAADADTLGLKFESVECAILSAQLEIDARRYGPAREHLQAALTRADRLGAQLLVARIHHLLARASSALGDTVEARRHADRARQVLEVIRKDAGDRVLQRTDIQRLLDSVKS